MRRMASVPILREQVRLRTFRGEFVTILCEMIFWAKAHLQSGRLTFRC